MVLISLLLLSGCTTTQYSNTCPAPHFPSCEVVRAAEKSEDDSLWKYLLRSTNVMLKLREGQEEDERDEFVDCKAYRRDDNDSTSR